MAVSDILPGLGSPVVGTGDYAGWVYTIIGGMFIGMYSADKTIALNDSSSLSKTGFYVSGRVDINIPVSIDTSKANIVSNVYDADLSRLTPYPSAANFRSATTIGLRLVSVNSITSVNLKVAVLVVGKVA